MQDVDFSQTTPPKPHPQPTIDVKEMNFDPLIPVSTGNSGNDSSTSASGVGGVSGVSGVGGVGGVGLLDAMEIHHHTSPSAPSQGNTGRNTSAPPANSTRSVFVSVFLSNVSVN